MDESMDPILPPTRSWSEVCIFDLRIHFGLGKAEKVFVKEGEGMVRTMQFPGAQKTKSGK